MIHKIIGNILLLFLLSIPYLKSQDIYPKDSWQMIANPEQLGWSLTKLHQAQLIADTIGSDAVMIVYRGAMLKAWGDIERKYMCHSMRKSFLSALYGIQVDQGAIQLGTSLSDLGIDNSPYNLSSVEKSATIEHLLSSRSGIYVPAAYEFPMRKPARGKYKPGENWLYPNNFDYIVLLTIYEQKTGTKFFEDFHTKIALPIGMNDFDISDGYYHYELHKSSHPAYPFRMSARDLARLGLLFLRQGKWEDEQLIPESWVEKSTSFISQTYNEREGYGYLWWVTKGSFAYPYYSAEGAGGHGIIVVPDLDLVIVHRVNTYLDKRISYRQRGKLISKIMEAYTGEMPESQMVLRDIEPATYSLPYNFIPLTNPQLYVGTYNIQKLLDYESTEVEVYLEQNNQLAIYIPYKGYFSIKPLSETLFMLEDSHEFVSFLMDEQNNPQNIFYHRDSRMGEMK